MHEDALLTQVDIDRALAKLEPADRELVLLVFRVRQPLDWKYRWPPRYVDIGAYIGLKYEKRLLSEATIRYRRDAIQRMWRGLRGQLRRKHLESPPNHAKSTRRPT